MAVLEVYGTRASVNACDAKTTHKNGNKREHTQVYDRLQDPSFLAQDSSNTTSGKQTPKPPQQQEANRGRWVSEGIRAPPSSGGPPSSSSTPPSLEGAVRWVVQPWESVCGVYPFSSCN